MTHVVQLRLCSEAMQYKTIRLWYKTNTVQYKTICLWYKTNTVQYKTIRLWYKTTWQPMYLNISLVTTKIGNK